MRAALNRNGHLIGWLVPQGAPGKLLLQPAPMDRQARTPEGWRHYALQMLVREGDVLAHRSPEAFRVYVAGDPALTLEENDVPLPAGLPEPLEYGAARAGAPEEDESPVGYARADLRDRLDAANAAVHPEPTPDQARAGNYKHGHVTVHGIPIAIEVAAGGTRRGVGADGFTWERVLPCAYGRIKRSEGADGEQVDVFVGPHPESELVFVVDQQHAGGRFDEHKCVLGCRNESEARRLYLSCYEPGWQGLGGVTALTLPQFKRWLECGDLTRRVADQAV